MNKDLSNYRKSYEKSELLLSTVPDNPLQLFQTWFYEVDNSNSTDEANAMTISTIGLDGFPKSRVVLLKKYTYEGFIFYTNYNSEKGPSVMRGLSEGNLKDGETIRSASPLASCRYLRLWCYRLYFYNMDVQRGWGDLN